MSVTETMEATRETANEIRNAFDKRVLARHAAGLAVLAALADGREHASLATAFRTALADEAEARQAMEAAGVGMDSWTRNLMLAYPVPTVTP